MRVVYGGMCLTSNSAPATKATSFLSGLSFAKFILQIDVPFALESCVPGLASQMLAIKRASGSLLAVSQVLELHSD